MILRRAALMALVVAPTWELEAQAPLADVPFVLHQNAMIVTMVANDRDTLRLLLDTGWGAVALTDSAVVRLGRSGQTPTSGGWLTLSSLSVQGLRKSAVRAEEFRTADLAPLIGPHDGVLATEFFRDLVVQVDYPAGRLRFFARAPNGLRASGSSVPMTFSPSAGSLPFTDSVYINGRPVRGLFDTGGSGAFLVMPQLIKAERLEQSAETSTAQMGYLDGSMKRAPLRFARLASVRIGRFVVDTPRVILAPPGLSGDNWGHDVVIGYGFLRDYVVTFDYPARTITLERRPPSSTRNH